MSQEFRQWKKKNSAISMQFQQTTPIPVLLADEFIVSRNIVHRQHRISKIEVLISTDAANFDDDYRFSSFSLYA